MAELGDLNRNEIAALLGVNPRSITNYQKEDPPIPTRRLRGGHVVFPAAPCVAWFVEFKLATTMKTGPSELDLAKQRKEVAGARKIELEVALLESQQIPTDKHLARVRAICEAMAGAVKGLNRYVPKIREASSDVEADAIADQMEDELLKALQSTEDAIPDEEPGGDDSSALAA